MLDSVSLFFSLFGAVLCLLGVVETSYTENFREFNTLKFLVIGHTR